MIDVNEILTLHAETVEAWHAMPISNPYQGLLATICQQHAFNFQLWHEEDIARSPHASDAEIAAVKRAIDRFNQQRNDWIERIDDEIEQMLTQLGTVCDPAAELHTETPGSAIDRLSIMSLRVFHLREQLERDDVGPEHIQKVEQRLAVCLQQKQRLSAALVQLLDGIFAGRIAHRTYRQFKMYNDETLNPYLYQTKPPAVSRRSA